MSSWLATRLAALIPEWPRCRVVVALSGGVDSVVLLHMLVQLRRMPALRGRLRIRAVHVDHHLQSASGEWRDFCVRLAMAWRVPLTVRDANIQLRRGDSLEAAARDARYALLAAGLDVHEHLLTAQHQDDQLETILLQLLRGAGPAGLSGMGADSALGVGRMLRPLLETSRAKIEAYAHAHRLRWIDDPSNADLRFDRNYLRARVLPALLERWPAAAATASRSARHLAETQQLVNQLAQFDLADLQRGEAPSLEGPPLEGLPLEALRKLAAARQRAATRLWLAQHQCLMPDEAHLARILRELPAARADANPLVRWPGGEVRRYQGVLVVVPPLPAGGNSLVWDWRRERRLALGQGMGYLEAVNRADGPWLRSQLPARLSVTFRRGGERFAVQAQHRRLKELLRSAGVFPWMRARLPLVSGAGELWCVPGVWQRSVTVASRSSGRAVRVAIEWYDGPAWRLSGR